MPKLKDTTKTKRMKMLDSSSFPHITELVVGDNNYIVVIKKPQQYKSITFSTSSALEVRRKTYSGKETLNVGIPLEGEGCLTISEKTLKIEAKSFNVLDIIDDKIVADYLERSRKEILKNLPGMGNVKSLVQGSCLAIKELKVLNGIDRGEEWIESLLLLPKGIGSKTLSLDSVANAILKNLIALLEEEEAKKGYEFFFGSQFGSEKTEKLTSRSKSRIENQSQIVSQVLLKYPANKKSRFDFYKTMLCCFVLATPVDFNGFFDYKKQQQPATQQEKKQLKKEINSDFSDTLKVELKHLPCHKNANLYNKGLNEFLCSLVCADNPYMEISLRTEKEISVLYKKILFAERLLEIINDFQCSLNSDTEKKTEYICLALKQIKAKLDNDKNSRIIFEYVFGYIPVYTC